MFFAVFAVKVFHYSQREKKKILTAKVAKEAAKGSKVSITQIRTPGITVTLDVFPRSYENQFAEVIYAALFVRPACGCISLPNPSPSTPSVGLYPALGLATLLWRVRIAAATLVPGCASGGN
jgi:hypothetical protein